MPNPIGAEVTEPVELDVSTTIQTGLPTADAPETPAAQIPEAPPVVTETRRAINSEMERIRKRNPVTMPQLPQKDPATGRFVKPGAAAPAVAKPPQAVPAKPAAPAAAGAKPQPSAAAKPAAAAAAPTRIKVGGKEYSEQELQKLIEKGAQPSQPAPQQPPQPATPPRAPEEDSRKTAQEEQTFIQEHSARFQPPLSEAEFETMLVGGKEGFAAFQKLIQTLGARSMLESRRTIYDDLTPVLAQIHETVQPLIQQHQLLEEHTTRALFTSRHPDFAPDVQQAESLARAYTAKYPNEVASMGREKFVDFIASVLDQQLQADYLKWNPNATNTWRDYRKSLAEPAQQSQQIPPVPAAGQQQPKRQVKLPAPAANAPAGAAAGSKPLTPRDWQRGVAASLAGG